MNGASFRRALRVATLCAVAALAACGWSENKPKFQASDITGVDWGKDFHLVDVNGTSRSLAHYRGKVVMVFFGYTNCPDACPTTLAKMAQAVDRLGADGQRVQGLFVTLDPARDTPAILAQYVPAFHPTFVGLSADNATIAATAKDFKIFYQPQKADVNGFYTVDHSSAIFVFDTRGRLRLFMGANVWVDAMVHDLKLLLSEPSASDQQATRAGTRISTNVP
ncbi:MAG TPA: SCO family protein [Casimicrobiaceae bacterium]